MADMTGPRLYSCSNCRTHVAYHDDIVSKAFQGRHGRAFLFSHAMNIVVGPKENRNLMTGLHTVADVYCDDCRQVLGWKYERAYVESQKYKEGKFILEKSKIVNENWTQRRFLVQQPAACAAQSRTRIMLLALFSYLVGFFRGIWHSY